MKKEGFRDKRNRHKHKNVKEFAFCIPDVCKKSWSKAVWHKQRICRSFPSLCTIFKRKLCVFWYLHLMILVSKSVLARVSLFTMQHLRSEINVLFLCCSLTCLSPVAIQNGIFIQFYHCLGPVSSVLECFYCTNTKSSRNNWQNPHSSYRNIQSYKCCPDVY